MAIPWFIPHRRYLPEDLDTKSTSATVDSDSSSDEKSKVKELEVTTEVKDENADTLAYLQDAKGERYAVREFRNEAGKAWYKYFDEYEYRETKEQASQYKWWKWFKDGTSPEEKKLLCKLDLLITVYSFVGYWIKYLDSYNLNNAYVSNMKEDLGMAGNDLVNTQVIFNVGNVLFEVAWIFLLSRIPINYGLFVSEACWAAFTVGTFKVTSVRQLQTVRFFVGAFESAYFPCINYTLGSWYLPSEISRRGGFFYIGQFVGVLTSGLLQSAIYNNLDGAAGLANWRWTFIIDGCISFVVAIWGLISLPNSPFSCYSIFLTDDEIRLARKRMIDNGTDPSMHSESIFNWSKWKKTFSSWHVWLLAFTNVFAYNINSSPSGSFVLWLKSLGTYTIGKVNNLSSVPPSLGILYVLIVCLVADITRRRFLIVEFSFIMNFIGCFILELWDVPAGAKWYGFCSAYWAWSYSCVFYPLASDVFRHDNEVRAIGWMMVYGWGLLTYCWMTRVQWPTVDSPRFHTGFSTCAWFSIAALVIFALFYYTYKRDEKKESLKNGIFVYNSDKKSLEESLSDYKVEYT